MEKREKLIQRLIDCGALQVKEEQIVVEEELTAENEYNENDIGVTPNGTKYVIPLAIQYLKEHNYAMTPQNMELAAKMAEMNEGKVKTKHLKTTVHHELENASYEEIQDFMKISLLENVVKLCKEIRS